MSDNGNSPAPRRSQRDKKKATHFVSVDSALIKRKRSDATTTDDDARSELSESDHDEADQDVQEDYDAPRPKSKLPANASSKPKGPPQPKKPRTAKAPAARKTTAGKASAAPKTTVSKPRKATTRKAKGTAVNGEFDAERVAQDSKISSDNPLFNAIMNPAAALQSTVEDFLESLSRTPGPSQAELITCILRACGCNDSVNEDEVMDYDGVVDALDNFTEALKQYDSPIYPLTSKLPVFKKFRRSLSEFLDRLIGSAAELGLLYTSDLMATLQTWVVAMSSSQLRSFRHTATVIALEVETALCDVAATVEKEAEVVSRQREGERKRKAAANKGKAESAREKELGGKAVEVRERRSKLAEFLKEFVDGVFVHRYRDLDPNIRAECVRAMGLWFKKYPAHFLDGAYLRYVGWVLSDATTQVRLEAVRALALAYEQTAYIGAAALQHFTERFKPRLVQMAVGDTELSVRVAVIQVLQAIDGHGLLEDEQRERLCLLLYDEEARVRKAVSGFVKGVWEECVEERLVGKKASNQDKQRAGIKALGMLLVKWGKALGKTDQEDEVDDENDLGEGSSTQHRAEEVASLVGPDRKGRISLVMEALWDEIEPVSNWQDLLDILLLDHSASDEESTSRRPTGRKRKQAADNGVDEVWRLEEEEEAVLLEMLIAVLRKALSDVIGAKKGEDETLSSDITRALIKSLPQLFIKHQTDENRMTDVLMIPQLMNLDMYLEMRMMTAYTSLWDDITKQFLSHSSPVVLTTAVTTIKHMLDATSLSNTNSTKVLELEEELSTTLRDAIAEQGEIEIASFSEDEILKLGAICARLAALIGFRDMTGWMEEDEGGKQSSAWDIVSAVAERGRLGYKEEELMIDRALHLLTLHIMWKARGLITADGELSPEESRFHEKLREQRESLLEKLLEFVVGTQSNTVEGVRRSAFQNLMNLHILFCPSQSIASDGSLLPTSALPLTMDDEVQYRCAGFVESEIERYAEELLGDIAKAGDESENDDAESSDGHVSDAESEKRKGIRKKAGPARNNASDVQMMSRARLEREYVFMGVMATFLRAIRAGVIDIRNSAVLLAHHGRLGASFDLCSKVVIDILREEGMYKDNGETVVSVICRALQESFTLVLDSVERTEEHSVALAKALSACFLLRGAQLSIIRRLDSQFVVEIHTTLLTWISKHLAASEASKNKKSLAKAVTFFRVLQPLLSSIDNRDSLKIKAHLDQVVARARVEVSPTSKLWEPYRAYEKRLNATKDKALGAKGKRGPRKGAKSIDLTTDDDDEREGQTTGDEAPPTTRPKPRPVYSGARTEHDIEAVAISENDDPLPAGTPRGVPHNSTPRPRRSRPNPGSRESQSITPAETPEPHSPSRSDAELPPETAPNGYPTPVSRKRARSQDKEAQDDMNTAATPRHSSPEVESPSAPLPGSQETHISEVRIRRKRIRH
ncbi:hypothetical protein OBBRIDRAFT_747233 [Obba rivulosa]|uniref:SCD domain-containing protein n=1 Tax=Obba rivulosa TaxID=1052685 RepID=A0A8E2J4Q7_9APHY|nr:hypothetical protein OBBRIDRAFT_747233 [Obba rivulosa]